MRKIAISIIILILFLSISWSAGLVETGFLRNKSGVPVSSKVAMEFSLFESATGGNAVWASGELLVSVNQGLYSVGLGTEINPINSDLLSSAKDYYLEVSVAGEKMSERELIGSVIKSIVSERSSFSGTANLALTANYAEQANVAREVAWSGIKDKPLTMEGFGITDMLTQTAGTANRAITANNFWCKTQSPGWTKFISLTMP